MQTKRSSLFAPPSSHVTLEKRLSTFFLRSWWMFLFLGLCYLFYSHGIDKKKKAFSEFKQRLSDLELEKQVALAEREDLLLQINSQSDPAWIQLMLMKGLGVVPEGQQKVYFEKE